MILCAGYLVFTKPRYLAPMLLHLATMHFMYVYDYRPNHCIMKSDAHHWDTRGQEAGCVMNIHTGSTTHECTPLSMTLKHFLQASTVKEA